MADAAKEDGPPLSELESLQLKANQITDDTLDSTRRMISLCEESQAVGIKTMDALEHQGEQLNRIEAGMDDIHGNIKTANKHLNNMEKWCGLCVCPWNRTRKVKDKTEVWGKKSDSSKTGPKTSQPTRGSAEPDSANNSAGGPIVQRITNDAREDEMEDNMQDVSKMLSNLKGMAQGMGSEISKQNTQLDRINVKGETVDVHVTAANKRAANLLK